MFFKEVNMELNLLTFEPEAQNFFCTGVKNESLIDGFHKQEVHSYGGE